MSDTVVVQVTESTVVKVPTAENTVATVVVQGEQGIQGVQGPSGVVSVVSPIKNAGSSTAAVLSLDPCFGGFYDDATQPLVSVSNPQQVAIGHTAYSKNVTRTNTGDIIATVAGNYSFTYSTVFANSNTQIQYASLWVKFNGATVPGTNTLVTVPSSHGGTPGYATGGNTFIVPMAVGDTIQLWWAGSSTDLRVHYVPAAGAIPAADSVLFSIRQIGS